MKKTWVDLVREGMSQKKLSQEELGSAIGKTQGGIGHWLHGRRQPNIEDVAKMFGVVGIDQVVLNSDGSFLPLENLNNEQFEFVGRPKDDRMIPAMGEITMDKDGILSLTKEHIGFVKIESQDPKAYCLRVRGSNAEPRIRSGEFILIEPTTPIENGDDVLIEYQDGHYDIRVYEYTRDDEYRFSNINGTGNAESVPKDEVSRVDLIAGTIHRSRFTSLEEAVKQATPEQPIRSE